MNLLYDTIIVGAGLAGSCSAFVLSEAERVLLLDAGEIGGAASGVPVGIVSPLMARRARPVWHMAQAVEAFAAVVADSDSAQHVNAAGVLKPAGSPEQALEFKDAAEKWPEHGCWLGREGVAERWPNLTAELGALFVTSGCAVGMPAWCRSVVAAAESRGASIRLNTRLDRWEESRRSVSVTCNTGERFEGRRLLLAAGYGYRHFPALLRLRLHPIKGQWIRLSRPTSVPAGTAVSSRIFLVTENSRVIIGGGYEHEFTNIRPTEAVSRSLFTEALKIFPELSESRMLGKGAGVRVTVPEIRLPMIGPIPGHQNVWIFSGLGAKGLLMATLIARRLPQFFAEPGTIPREICVNLVK